jgi:hypothetical protein
MTHTIAAPLTTTGGALDALRDSFDVTDVLDPSTDRETVDRLAEENGGRHARSTAATTSSSTGTHSVQRSSASTTAKPATSRQPSTQQPTKHCTPTHAAKCCKF